MSPLLPKLTVQKGSKAGVIVPVLSRSVRSHKTAEWAREHRIFAGTVVSFFKLSGPTY